MPTWGILPPFPTLRKTLLLPPPLPHIGKTLGKSWNMPLKTYYVFFMHSSYNEPNNELFSLSFKVNLSFSRFIKLFLTVKSWIINTGGQGNLYSSCSTGWLFSFLSTLPSLSSSTRIVSSDHLGQRNKLIWMWIFQS